MRLLPPLPPDRDRMWIFDRGIRRRFAPMMDGDLQRLKLVYSLLAEPARHPRD